MKSRLKPDRPYTAQFQYGKRFRLLRLDSFSSHLTIPLPPDPFHLSKNVTTNIITSPSPLLSLIGLPSCRRLLLVGIEFFRIVIRFLALAFDIIVSLLPSTKARWCISWYVAQENRAKKISCRSNYREYAANF